MRTVSLDDRYELKKGSVYLSGIQAIVRAVVDDARRQARTGLRIGSFISGYPGSPLGGLDLALLREQALLDRYGIVFRPGVNEELAATAVLGATKRTVFTDRVDGVNGIWYGKCNGVDRCVDIFKYGNYGGMGRHDAVIALAGDDPSAKSSGIPGESEYTLAAAGMPILAPATVAEIVAFIGHGLALSRFTGCWSGLKLVTDLCDGGATVTVDPETPEIVIPDVDGFDKFDTYLYFGQPILDAERDLFGPRHAAVRAYARANGLDGASISGPDDRFGVITYGKAHADILQAFSDLGLDAARLREAGVRLIKVGMPYPLDEKRMRELTAGLTDVMVIEEKRGFLEDQLRAALYGRSDAPRITGKSDEEGHALVPVRGELEVDTITQILRTRLSGLMEMPAGRSAPVELSILSPARRMPNYCSGCPHSRGTVSPEGSVVLGGIGCHSMGLFMTQPERRYSYNVQMGGEGVPWVGASPFVDTPHILQNLGDGTYFHSASLAIRQCVESGVDLTFRLLYNGFVSMTGGQELAGAAGVAALTRELEAIGVGRIVVITEEKKLRGLGARTSLAAPDEMVGALADLAAESGVTVIIHDRECALERRRAWRRGGEPPRTRLLIHERLCEGCGDCGAKSNCPSLEPIDTDLGRKTRIQQSSCSVDLACLKGDCPAFVSVTMGEALLPPRPAPPAVPAEMLPEPGVALDSEATAVFSVGIGGTGVVTVNAMLAFAALMEGLEARTLDQTGLAQKGGPVVSHCIVGRRADLLNANKVSVGAADLYLAFDLLEAAHPTNLRRANRMTNVVVDTSLTPTGEMIRNVDVPMPDPQPLIGLIRDRVGGRVVEIPARRIAEGLFGDHMKANVITAGAAGQAGLLPVPPGTFESAIRLNGVEVEENLLAFRYGRLWVADPGRVVELLDSKSPTPQIRLTGRRAADHRRLRAEVERLPEALRESVSRRSADLIAYQDARYAEEYVGFLTTVAEAEERATPGKSAISERVSLHLYRLMAYKDEYEVARLLRDKAWRNEVRGAFGPDARISYNLHPPLLRSLGYGKKIRLGGWVGPLLGALARMRRLRRSRLNPFGWSATRRLERELPDWYRSCVEEALSNLNEATHDEVLTIAGAPAAVRGYEDVKLRSAARVRAEVAEILDRLRTGDRS